MELLFLKVLNMSISAIWIVLAVVLMRLILKKAPKAIYVALWAIVALRLVVPFSFESSVSLIPSAETIPESIVDQPFTGINSGFDVIDDRVNEYFIDSKPNNEQTDSPSLPVERPNNTLEIISNIWLCGVGGMAVYFLISYALLYRKVKASINIGNNVYVCDDIASPFILGVIRPKIYLPPHLNDEQINHILAHENAHIKRRDNWWKPVGFAVLTVHWFNPVIWIAYVLLCRDIEYACDEKVIKSMDGESVRSYSETLLNCSISSKRITACPVAFGEVSVKERIKTVLSYKKPTFWIILTAILACAVTAAVFLTNPNNEKTENQENENNDVRIEIDYETESSLTGHFTDTSAPFFTEALNASMIIKDHSPVYVFDEYDAIESFLKKYGSQDYSLLKKFDRDYFDNKSVIVVYTEDTFQEQNIVSGIEKNGSMLTVKFASEFTENNTPGYRCKLHAIGVEKSVLVGVDTYIAKAKKPIPPENPSVPVDNTVYDVSYSGYSTPTAFFIDLASPLYNRSLNYREVIDKTVYSCPLHMFNSHDAMKDMLEPYKTSDLVGMDVAVDRVLEQGKTVFESYDTVFVAYVKSYNSEITFYPSSLKKQGNKLTFGISSKGPEIISDNQSGWFVLFGVNGSDIEGCTNYSATVTDREFFVIPQIKTEVFKINKTFGLDDDIYTNAINAPFTVNGSQYEMPVYVFKNASDLQKTFEGTERLTGEKNWMAKYNSEYFENKALVVAYFSAPGDSHYYGLSDSGYNMLRTELSGAFIYLEAMRTDPPNQEETDTPQGWIIVLETDKRHLERNSITVYGFVEFQNTRRH